jgi:hypothetical protein
MYGTVLVWKPFRSKIFLVGNNARFEKNNFFSFSFGEKQKHNSSRKFVFQVKDLANGNPVVPPRVPGLYLK